MCRDHGVRHRPGEAEYLNPTGSIKDRMVNFILNEAIRKGTLKPGGTIVEATSATRAPQWRCSRGKRVQGDTHNPDKMSKEKVMP